MTPETRSKQNARDAAVNLTTTLHELGVDHDWGSPRRTRGRTEEPARHRR